MDKSTYFVELGEMALYKWPICFGNDLFKETFVNRYICFAVLKKHVDICFLWCFLILQIQQNTHRLAFAVFLSLTEVMGVRKWHLHPLKNKTREKLIYIIILINILPTILPRISGFAHSHTRTHLKNCLGRMLKKFFFFEFSRN